MNKWQNIILIYINLPFIGLRFFTIYGDWGRPDMFILKTLIGNDKKNI